VSAQVFVCAGYILIHHVSLKSSIEMILLHVLDPNLLSVIVYHELKPFPFSYFEYGGDIKPDTKFNKHRTLSFV
jgi:hypothetical protein